MRCSMYSVGRGGGLTCNAGINVDPRHPLRDYGQKI